MLKLWLKKANVVKVVGYHWPNVDLDAKTG
jgi:hypothetical protein